MVGHVASEILMCGLKNLPVVGPASEFVRGVQARRRNADFEARLSILERLWGGANPARQAMDQFFDEVCAPACDPQKLNGSIRRLGDLGRRGLSAPAFDGLLASGGHWDNFRQNPQMYGRVLGDRDELDSTKVTVLLGTDKLRVVEVPPFMFAELLAGGWRERPKVVGRGDAWAVSPMTTPDGWGEGVGMPASPARPMHDPVRLAGQEPDAKGRAVVACPGCTHVMRVVVPPPGRRVRYTCRKCRHQWHEAAPRRDEEPSLDLEFE